MKPENPGRKSVRGHQGRTQPGADGGQRVCPGSWWGKPPPPPGPLPRRSRARLRTGCPPPEDRTTSTLWGTRGVVSTLTDVSTKPPLTPNSAPSGCPPRSGCCLPATPGSRAYLLLSAQFGDENSAERRLERPRCAWTRPPGGTERPLLPRADAAAGAHCCLPEHPTGVRTASRTRLRDEGQESGRGVWKTPRGSGSFRPQRLRRPRETSRHVLRKTRGETLLHGVPGEEERPRSTGGGRRRLLRVQRPPSRP